MFDTRRVARVKIEGQYINGFVSNPEFENDLLLFQPFDNKDSWYVELKDIQLWTKS